MKKEETIKVDKEINLGKLLEEIYGKVTFSHGPNPNDILIKGFRPKERIKAIKLVEMKPEEELHIRIEKLTLTEKLNILKILKDEDDK